MGYFGTGVLQGFAQGQAVMQERDMRKRQLDFEQKRLKMQEDEHTLQMDMFKQNLNYMLMNPMLRHGMGGQGTAAPAVPPSQAGAPYSLRQSLMDGLNLPTPAAAPSAAPTTPAPQQTDQAGQAQFSPEEKQQFLAWLNKGLSMPGFQLPTGLLDVAEREGLLPEKPKTKQELLVGPEGQLKEFDLGAGESPPSGWTTSGQVPTSSEKDLNTEAQRRLKSGTLKPEGVFAWKQQQRQIAAGGLAQAKAKGLQDMMNKDITPEALDYMSRRYRSGDSIASLVKGFGPAATLLGTKVIGLAARQAKDEGKTAESDILRRIGVQTAKSELQRVKGLHGMTEQFERTANKNLDYAERLGAKVERSGSPIWNRWALWGRGEIKGEADVLAFDRAVKSAMVEYAKVITGQITGQAVTDSAREEYTKFLNAAYAGQAFKEIANVMRTEMGNRMSSFPETESRIGQEILDIQGASKDQPSGGGDLDFNQYYENEMKKLNQGATK